MTLLLIVIYIAFIGLGVPDSLFGAAMPAIVVDFELPLAAPNLVTLLVSGCTVLSSMYSARILQRLGTAKVTALSTAVTALALLGYAVSGNLLFMLLCAIPLGLGAGAIDAGLNNFIALHYGATHMNFLHCFYGFGVIISPYLMSLMLERASWREGYLAAFGLQAGIALLLFLSLPLWKKARDAGSGNQEAGMRPLSLGQMIRTPTIRHAWLMSFATNAIEAISGIWGSTYLVHSHGLTPDTGARAIILYYVGMTLGRFLSGVFAHRLGSRRLIRIGLGVLVCACVLLLLPLGSAAASIAALFLIGLGNGPIYPNMVNLVPENFGRDISASVIGAQMAVAYLGFMLAPPLFGLIAQGIGVAAMPTVLTIWLVLLIAGTLLLRKRLKQEGRIPI